MIFFCINSYFVFPQQKAKEAPEKTDEQQTQASDSGLRRRRWHVAEPRSLRLFPQSAIGTSLKQGDSPTAFYKTANGTSERDSIHVYIMFLPPPFFYVRVFWLYFTRAFTNSSKIFFRKSAFTSLPLTSFCNIDLSFGRKVAGPLLNWEVFFAEKHKNTPVSCLVNSHFLSAPATCQWLLGRVMFREPKYTI